MLAEFRALTGDQALGSGEGDGSGVGDDRADVIELTSAPVLPADGAVGSWWQRAGLGVAASLLVLLGSVNWLQRTSDPDQSVETATADAPLLEPAGDDGTGAVDPGRYSVVDVGGGIELTLPEGVTVVAAGPGFVELASPVGRAVW